MTISIPAWVVGTIGASFILVATIICVSSDLIIQSKLKIKQEALSQLEKKTENAWDNMKVADERVAKAVNSIGLFLVAKSEPLFYLPNAAQNLRGAILALYVAADKDVPPQPPHEVSMLETQLTNGNFEAYGKLHSILEKLRLDAALAMNETAENRRDIEQQILDLEGTKSFWSKIFVGLNMLGLAIVLLKDLPIWRT